MDLFDLAVALHVVDVHIPGNETGWVTPKVLYDPSVKTPQGLVVAPRLTSRQFSIDHGTAGTNTLRFWGEGQSAVPGNWTLAHYLVPKDATVYKDGLAHDTSVVVFKMVPDGFGCNHAGACVGPITNNNSIGTEYESVQNGTHDITDLQYRKGALIYAHDSAFWGMKDWWRVAHGLVAINPWGRRSDPFAGLFEIGYSWELVQAVRRDARIWQHWGIPQPSF